MWIFHVMYEIIPSQCSHIGRAECTRQVCLRPYCYRKPHLLIVSPYPSTSPSVTPRVTKFRLPALDNAANVWYTITTPNRKGEHEMTLGQRIVQIRTEHSLSQERFAEKLGTTRQTVSRWELDLTYPTLDHIVRISRIFSVTTDSILRDGISTFDEETPYFSCGVYRGRDCEIVETERFALKFYHSADKTRLGAGLYRGFENSKRLTAICEYDLTTQTAEYAYLVDGCEPHTAVCNSERMAGQLTAPYNPDETRPLRRLETFSVDREHTPRPTVREAGIPGCLNAWRMGDSYTADHDRMHFLLCTGSGNRPHRCTS